MRLFFSALFLALTLVSPARATDLTASAIDVTFHIAHPAKEYDAKLLKDGATATATFDPADLSTLTLVTSIRVELFNSDNKRRDSHMIETLEGLVFPTIEWTVSSVKGLSGPVSAGTYEFIAVGPMTLHGVTKDLEIPVQLVIDDAMHLTATSDFSINLEAWGIERPTLLFIPIADNVPIEVRMAFPGAGKFVFPGPAMAPTPEEVTPEEAAPEAEAAPDGGAE